MKKYFGSMDVFQTPVYLNFQKHEKHSTNFGIILSVGLIVFLCVMFFRSDVFYKNTPKVENVDRIQGHRPPISFTNRILTFAIEDEESLAYIEPSICTLEITNKFMKIIDAEDFQTIQEIKKIPYSCTESDFPPNIFVSQGYSNNYCINDTSFMTEGFWDEEIFTFLEVNVKICDNSTSSVKCKTLDEIQKFFKDKYFNVYYSSTTVDTSNYEKPISNLINNEYYKLDFSLRKELSIYLKNLEIITDDAYILDTDDSISDIIFDSKEIDQRLNLDHTIEKPIFTCYFYSSRKTQKIRRAYQKLDEALANLGGIANIVIVVGFLFSSFEKTLDLKKKVMNKLYSFQTMKQVEKRKSEIIKRKSLLNQVKKSKIDIESQNLNPPPDIKEIDISSARVLESSRSNNVVSLNEIKKILNEIPNNFIENGEKEDKEKEKLDQFEKGDIELMENQVEYVKSVIPSLKNIIAPNFYSPHALMPKIFKVNNQNINEENFHDEVEVKVAENKEKPPLEPSPKNDDTSKITKSIIKQSKTMSFKKSKTQNEKMENAEKFEEFMHENNSKARIKFSIHEYILFNFKNFFRMKLSEKEKLFLKGVDLYKKEIDIVSILHKLQELEKLKCVLLNQDQLVLFNLLEKPLVYLEDEEIDDGEKSEDNAKERLTKLMQSSTITTKGKTGISQAHLKKVFDHFDQLDKKKELTEVDKRLMGLVNENLAKFANNF